MATGDHEHLFLDISINSIAKADNTGASPSKGSIIVDSCTDRRVVSACFAQEFVRSHATQSHRSEKWLKRATADVEVAAAEVVVGEALGQ